MHTKNLWHSNRSGCGRIVKKSLIHASSGIGVIVKEQVVLSPGRHTLLSKSKISPSKHQKSILLPSMHMKWFWQFSGFTPIRNISSSHVSDATRVAIARIKKMSVEEMKWKYLKKILNWYLQQLTNFHIFPAAVVPSSCWF